MESVDLLGCSKHQKHDDLDTDDEADNVSSETLMQSVECIGREETTSRKRKPSPSESTSAEVGDSGTGIRKRRSRDIMKDPLIEALNSRLLEIDRELLYEEEGSTVDDPIRVWFNSWNLELEKERENIISAMTVKIPGFKHCSRPPKFKKEFDISKDEFPDMKEELEDYHFTVVGKTQQDLDSGIDLAWSLLRTTYKVVSRDKERRKKMGENSSSNESQQSFPQSDNGAPESSNVYSVTEPPYRRRTL